MRTSNGMDKNVLELSDSVFRKNPGVREVLVMEPRKTSLIVVEGI